MAVDATAVPSPNDHLSEVILLPGAGVDPEASKRIVDGALPVVIEGLITAVPGKPVASADVPLMLYCPMLPYFV